MIQRFGACALAARFLVSRSAGRCLAIVLVFLGAAVVQAQAQAPLGISSEADRTLPAQAPPQARPQAPPQTDPGYRPALPAFAGRVVDTADMLDVATVKRLDDVLAAHEAATSDQVVVVTLPSLGGMVIEEFGYQLGRKWGVGQRGKDNGVLLIVSRDDRKLRIEVGYGLEGKLTDADASAIINRTITPAFRQNDYAGGIERGVAAILRKLSGSAAAEVEKTAGHWTPLRLNLRQSTVGSVVLMFGGFILLACLTSLISRFRAFRRKEPRAKPLILGAAASGAGRTGTRGNRGVRTGGSVSSSTSRSSSSSRSSSRSDRSRGGGGSFGGGGASGGW